MKIEEINRIAFTKGVDPAGKNKLQIIREIQNKEGYEPCYGTKKFECKQTDCLWREDCQGKAKIINVIKMALIMFLLG